jgi:hypothetical protein
MSNPEIELKKERDFSDVFNASFTFINQNAKRLLTVIGLYAGIPVIIAIVLNAYYTQDALTSFSKMLDSSQSVTLPDFSMLFVSLFSSVLAQIFIFGLVPAYFKEYEAKGKSGFTAHDVWLRFMNNFVAIIGYSLLIGIFITIGFIIFVIPGIYLSVTLSFILFVKIIEERNLENSLSRCFRLISDNWWITFGILIVAIIIFSIISTLFSLPAIIVGAIEGFLVGSGQKAAIDAKSFAIVITTVLGGIGQYLLYPVVYVIMAFQYYNLREKKDRDVLMDKVSAINE